MIELACALFAAASAPAAPVEPDGFILPAEWRGARCIETPAGFLLLARWAGGRLEVATKAPAEGSHFTEIAIRRPGGEILTLHASAQLGQRVHRHGSEPPAWRWGNNQGWTANRVAVSRDEGGGWRIGRYEGQEMILEPELLEGAEAIAVTIHAFDTGEMLAEVPLPTGPAG